MDNEEIIRQLKDMQYNEIINLIEDKKIPDKIKIKKLIIECELQGGIDIIYDPNDEINCGTCDFLLADGSNCLLNIIAGKLKYKHKS
ncbi:MAG: hypothetical protein ACYDDE_00615 [bacterium]